MSRREFIALLGGTAACASLPAVAQAFRKTVALVLTSVSAAEIAGPDPSFAPARAFVHELRDLGWVDGNTISIERLSLEGNSESARALLGDLVARSVDVICARRSPLAARVRAGRDANHSPRHLVPG
jgi:putative ABC transport system substrate-binding protein